ncbi:glycosyltransferase family 39 protein [Halosquirtibacter xylanolyticus]|uniref:ArnT family glycosyltransferase n=1 Tax=Halosquirtibacter xylanolyticus TaxID=3374599 RepID=UPI003747C495|nr:glycosyltransferase family 39 protein [Prolixibacteraceae bacterium]
MKKNTIYLLFLGIICFCFLFHLGQWGVLESSEARYAEIAREMVSTGDYLQPQLQGIYHFDKPPITYWITALGQNIFGINPFGSRFFLSIAYLIQLVLVYFITLKWFGKQRVSEITTVIYASLPVVIMSVRNLTTDAYLNTFSLLAIFLYTMHRRSKCPNIYHLLWGISLAILFMTKGPVAMLIPVLWIYPIKKMCPAKEPTYRITRWVSALIMIVLGGMWYVALIRNNQGLWDFFTQEQLVDRFANAQALRRSEPFYYYLYTFIPALLPWAFLPFTRGVKYDKKMQLILLFAVAIPMLFFSIASSKLILYPLPVAFGFAVWFGYIFHQKEEKKRKGQYLYGAFFFVLPVLMGIYAFLNIKGISTWWYLLLIFDYTILVTLSCRQSKISNSILIASFAIPMILVPYSPTILEKIELDINGTTPLTEFIVQRGLNKGHVIVYDERVASLDFQLQKQTYEIEDGNYLLKRNTSFQKDTNWQKHLLSFKTQRTDIMKLVNQPSILIFKYKVPKQALFLTRAYNKQVHIGKWILYYHHKDIESSTLRVE